MHPGVAQFPVLAADDHGGVIERDAKAAFAPAQRLFRLLALKQTPNCAATAAMSATILSSCACACVRKKEITACTVSRVRMGMPTAVLMPTARARGARGKLASRVTSGIQTGFLDAMTRPGRPTPGPNS